MSERSNRSEMIGNLVKGVLTFVVALSFNDFFRGLFELLDSNLDEVILKLIYLIIIIGLVSLFVYFNPKNILYTSTTPVTTEK